MLHVEIWMGKLFKKTFNDCCLDKVYWVKKGNTERKVTMCKSF